MIEMSCPGCGRAGQCPKEKLHTRLVCRKCHVVFHVDTSGRAVMGDPNQPPKKDVKKKAKEGQTLLETLHLPKFEKFNRVSDNLSEYGLPVKPVLAGVGALVVFWVLYGIFNAAPEAISDPSRGAVEALAHDNLDRLQSYATEDSREDLGRWYDMVHGRLLKERAAWPSKETAVQIVVVEEDHGLRKGVVEAFLVPSANTTQTASVLPTGGAGSNSKAIVPTAPFGVQLHWIWTGKHWRIDGHQTYAAAPH